MWYLINLWKLLPENPQAPPEKIQFPLFTHSPLKIQKVQVPRFCQYWKFFRTLLQKDGGRGGGGGGGGGEGGGRYVKLL